MRAVNLKLYRKRKGLKQQELAELIGVTYGAVSSWERGIRCMDWGMAERISEVLGIRPFELFSDDNAENALTNSSGELLTLEQVTDIVALLSEKAGNPMIKEYFDLMVLTAVDHKKGVHETFIQLEVEAFERK